MTYLSDVEEGGATHFPELGIEVKPKAGRALLWADVVADKPLMRDPRTTHEALPVIKGTKYVANTWFEQYDRHANEAANCCESPDPDDDEEDGELSSHLHGISCLVLAEKVEEEIGNFDDQRSSEWKHEQIAQRMQQAAVELYGKTSAAFKDDFVARLAKVKVAKESFGAVEACKVLIEHYDLI
ncbi:unnamed protein product [Polarella glacialis]|nr:unnamed protein product [Polarella glacialis]